MSELVIYQLPQVRDPVDVRDVIGAALAMFSAASADDRAAAIAAAWRARCTGEDAAQLYTDRRMLGPLKVSAVPKRPRSRKAKP